MSGKHTTPERFTSDLTGHTPAWIKANETLTLYNPFWYDLTTTKLKINPDWLSSPGVTLNWLLRDDGEDWHLIVGVDADTPGNFLTFADRFAVGHRLSADDAVRLCRLGHPTLAHLGPGPAGGRDLGQQALASYVGHTSNYSGFLGGELLFKHEHWWINERSGRYGSHRWGNNRMTIRNGGLYLATKMFEAHAGINVLIDK